MNVYENILPWYFAYKKPYVGNDFSKVTVPMNNFNRNMHPTTYIFLDIFWDFQIRHFFLINCWNKFPVSHKDNATGVQLVALSSWDTGNLFQ